MGRANRGQIHSFLMTFKAAASKNGVYCIDRRDHINALSELGLTKLEREEILLSLSVSDYCDGPKPDRDLPGDLWEFGKVVDEKMVYIKLKVAVDGRQILAKCISFHEAKHTMDFPYQKKGGSQ